MVAFWGYHIKMQSSKSPLCAQAPGIGCAQDQESSFFQPPPYTYLYLLYPNTLSKVTIEVESTSGEKNIGKVNHQCKQNQVYYSLSVSSVSGRQTQVCRFSEENKQAEGWFLSSAVAQMEGMVSDYSLFYFTYLIINQKYCFIDHQNYIFIPFNS